MKEFIGKLIGRLEEEHERCINRYGVVGGNAPAMEVKQCMAIVNQLAEEYNNDFCEWKKTDKRKSSPYHHALKHGNITLEFHDDFKICPYCGKKIKVVER